VNKNLQPDVGRYFIAVIPPPPVFEEVLRLKNYFREKYDSRAAFNAPPHITLHAPFLWDKQKEHLMISSLAEFSITQKSITLALSNFSAFPPRVIFIDVSNNVRLRQLQLDLCRFCEETLNVYSATSKHRSFHPHLTLAFRDLKRLQFNQAWEEFRTRTFSASFVVDKITLLSHNGKMWGSLKDFHF
jgi:2'-5' RNA ligase